MEASVMNTTKEHLRGLSEAEGIDQLFEEVKDSDVTEQDVACAILLETHGPAAVLKLRGRLAAHEWAQSGEEVHDDENPAENVRRKLLRMVSALRYVPVTEELKSKVWNLLKWMSQANPEGGIHAWVGWLADAGIGDMEARRLWNQGYSEAKVRADSIYAVAQAAGWRYVIWDNAARPDLVVPRCEAALIRGKAEIYRSGSNLVRPAVVSMEATRGRKTLVGRLIPFTPPDLLREISRYVDFIGGKKVVPIAPPTRLIQAILAGQGRWQFPMISGVISCPTMRRDGSILAKAGYDPETGLYLKNQVDMPPVKSDPSAADVREAVDTLTGLLEEFPFVDEASRAVPISAMLSTVCRGALTCVPMHACSAPAYGTGKSFMWDVVAGIVMGDIMPIIGAEAFEELIKRMDGELIKGVSVLSLDNVSFVLGGDTLCQVIERPLYVPRILGQSTTLERRNAWTLFTSGNNLRLKNDITRRSVLARIDAGVERPELRKFNGNPFESVLSDRGRYVAACLTIVRGYMCAGSPGRLNWIGDPFAEWSDLVRSAIVWAGMADPVATMEAVRQADPARQARVAVFTTIANAYGFGYENRRSANQMIADAKDRIIRKRGESPREGVGLLREPMQCNPAEDLRAALIAYTDDQLKSQYLGNKFNVDQNKITEGLTLRCVRDNHNKVNYWYIEKE
jgi:putative DNA primase/helicase